MFPGAKMLDFGSPLAVKIAHMAPKIEILQTELNIQFSDKVEDSFPFIWLRDHAKDELNWDERSNQRKTFTARIDTNLQIKEAFILENGKSLSILWSDLNSAVKYSYDFLKNTPLFKTPKVV